MAHELSVMSITEAWLTFCFGVCLPTWDVYSDLISAYRLIISQCYDYEAYKYYEKGLNWGRKYLHYNKLTIHNSVS